MNPKKLEMAEKGYEMQQQRKDIDNWQLGIYFANSLLSTVCNSPYFKKPSAPRHEYPESPIFAYSSVNKEVSKDNDEELKDKKIDMLFTKLNIMATNWKLNEGKEGVDNEREIVKTD